MYFSCICLSECLFFCMCLLLFFVSSYWCRGLECPAHAHVYMAEFRLAMPECVIMLRAFRYLLPKALIKNDHTA